MTPPSKEQAESLVHLFKSNNFHIQKFKEWLDRNMADSVNLMIDPSINTERLLRVTGEANALAYIKSVIDKHST
jgi:hypothetical protein